MGSILASFEGRWLLAVAIIISLGILLIGELYLIDVFLGGRRWLGGKVGKVVIFLFHALLYMSLYLVSFGFWTPRLFAPQPSSSGYFVNGLVFGAWVLIYIPVGGVSILISPLTRTPSVQPSVAPKMQWVKACWTLAGCLALGLALGLLIGGLLSVFFPYVPTAVADASLPLLQRASFLFTLGAAATIGLVSGVVVSFYKRLGWWVLSWRRERFPVIGAALIGIGCVIIAVSAWLIA